MSFVCKSAGRLGSTFVPANHQPDENKKQHKDYGTINVPQPLTDKQLLEAYKPMTYMEQSAKEGRGGGGGGGGDSDDVI